MGTVLGRILVIDDDPLILKVMVDLLKNAGFWVIGRGSPLGATQLMINENLNVPITFDLRNVPVERFGSVEIRLYVGGEHRRTLPIWVLQSVPQEA